MSFSTFSFLPTSRFQLDLDQWWCWCLANLGNSYFIPCSESIEIQTWTLSQDHQSIRRAEEYMPTWLFPGIGPPLYVQEVCVPTGLSAVAGKSILGIPCMSTDVFKGVQMLLWLEKLIQKPYWMWVVLSCVFSTHSCIKCSCLPIEPFKWGPCTWRSRTWNIATWKRETIACPGGIWRGYSPTPSWGRWQGGTL